MARLASLLSERFGGAQAFFCNSGAEAVESALKYARKATGRPGIVALENSFHGRTMGALAATGQKAKREAFEPLAGGVRFAVANDVSSLEERVDETTACVLLEPIQGEGGVRPLTAQFVQEARAIADANGALLVFDEVQTGVGRTGTFFAFEQLDVRPDAVTLAKGLANGLPVGALLVADSAAGAFVPGDHGSTFGGNPVACAAACAVCEALDEELLADVARKGLWFAAALESLPSVVDVRGAGLLLGAEITGDAAPVVAASLERGLLVGSAGERTLRLTPPLTIGDPELDQGLSILREVLK
jgi:acetylornithine/succinyldiaminopimelate/putrescine aminotransferase